MDEKVMNCKKPSHVSPCLVCFPYLFSHQDDEGFWLKLGKETLELSSLRRQTRHLLDCQENVRFWKCWCFCLFVYDMKYRWHRKLDRRAPRAFRQGWLLLCSRKCTFSFNHDNKIYEVMDQSWINLHKGYNDQKQKTKQKYINHKVLRNQFINHHPHNYFSQSCLALKNAFLVISLIFFSQPEILRNYR